jgi:hypothetical protein
VAGVVGVRVRENEDIFLGEVWGGDKIEVKKQEMDVYFD